MTITVKSNFNGQRLDKFLAEELNQSRNQIKKAILNGSVLVNNEPAKVHQFLRPGDIIDFEKKKTEKSPIRKELTNEKTPNLAQKLKTFFISKTIRNTPEIIQKNKNYLVIEKPTGLLVHPAPGSNEPTLVDWLVKKFPQVKKISDPEALKRNDQTYRPGIVHRLDKEVSGLMLIALNQKTFEYYKKQFKLKRVEKKYLAVVHGQMPLGSGQINFEISRSSEGSRMAAHPAGSNKGLKSLTEYNIVKTSKQYSLAEINLYTGRTNQIRVHFQAIGHPIVGDKLYCQKKFKKQNLESERLMLHAYKLGFVDQKNIKQQFSSRKPKEFNKFNF